MQHPSNAQRSGKTLLQIPNILTISRFVLSVVLFSLIFGSSKYEGQNGWFIAALCTFLIAGITDLLDGYIARRCGQETDFGRIADPFVDKILICGTFIFFVLYLDGDPYMKSGDYANITGWMVVLIVAREFLISALRGYAESKKIRFGAIGWGKRKMFLQSLTICAILAQHAFLVGAREFRIAVTILIWLTVAISLFSGLMYINRARKVFKI